MINSKQISAAYIGSTSVSAIYLGSALVWPTITRIFWRDFNPSSCVSLNITSSTEIARGLSWKNNDYSNILSGLNQYSYCYGSSIPVLNNGILAYWKLDNNGSGGVSLIDSSVNGRTLSAPNGTSGLSLGTGKINGSASFNGNGSTYLSRNGSFLSPNGARQSQYSVSLWVKTTNDIFIVNSVTGNNWGGGTITLDLLDGQIFPSVWWGGVENNEFDRFASGPDLRDGNWHHCAFTWDAYGDLIAYVDGVETGRIASAGNLANVNVNNLSFNSNADGTYLVGQSGQIDEVGIWNRVLTPTEITALYNNGNGSSYPF